MCERYFREYPEYISNIEPKMIQFQERGIWARIKREQVPYYYDSYDGIVLLKMCVDKNKELPNKNQNQGAYLYEPVICK
jgi:hypothetical protein